MAWSKEGYCDSLEFKDDNLCEESDKAQVSDRDTGVSMVIRLNGEDDSQSNILSRRDMHFVKIILENEPEEFC